jgi:hypothetical protein
VKFTVAHAVTSKILREDEQMAKKDNNTFIIVKDSEGEKFFCPINTNPDHLSDPIEVNDDCIEEDVAGRYAGNINIKPS